MKAIIVSAGQGKRLLPLTESSPKCLVPVQGERSILEVQLRALAKCGIRRVSIMVGFGAEQVDEAIAKMALSDIEVTTCYNPFYAMSDNLATVWLARSEMTEDFILINGDTVFEVALLERVLKSAVEPITVTVSTKEERYDDDDMKVSLDSHQRLTAIGKTLDASVVDAESIGMLVFRDKGVGIMRAALDVAVRESEGLKAWYLSVINQIAAEFPVATICISEFWWGEVDCPEDLDQVRSGLAKKGQDAGTVIPHHTASARA
jgi:choline kinase